MSSIADLVKVINRQGREIRVLTDAVNTMAKRLEVLEVIEDKQDEVIRLSHEQKSHNGNLHEEIKKDVKKVEFAVEDKIEEVKQIVDKKDVFMLDKGNLTEKIKKLFKRK